MNIDDILNKIDPSNLTIPFGKITNISAITLQEQVLKLQLEIL